MNTCRQWYQERDKILGSPQKIKNSARPRFTGNDFLVKISAGFLVKISAGLCDAVASLN